MEDVDDSFYSRQRCVLGEDAMRKMAKSKVFLYGLGGVGIEIAKNLILGGVEELIIQDDRVCESRDLYSQFFIRPEDVIRGISRAEASLPHLVALNPYVRVSVERRNLTTIRSPLEHKANEELLQALVANNEEQSRNVECLIVTQCPLHAAVLLNLFCRKHNIRFIYSDVYGAFGFLFCDFGVNFLIKDPTGETPKEFFIGHIEILNSTQILVKVFADRRHQLETGQVVEFRELSGMSELNGKAFAVQVVSSSELLIEMDTGNLSPYIGGGVAVQIVQPQIQHFDSLLEQLHEPRIATADLSHPNEGILLHHIFLSLMAFRHDEQRFPEPWCEADWALFNQKFQTLQSLVPYKLDQVDQEFVRRLALVSPGELSPLCAVFGGVVAQEAMKALTGCFTPYNQWFYMHCESVVPRTFPPSHSTLNASRYEPLAICIGFEPLQRLENLNVFMVGCGAIGCELLKNLALLGVATAQSDSQCPRFADYAGSKPGLDTVDSCKLDSLPSDDCRETGVIDQRSLCDSSNELARSARFCSTESMSPQLLPLHAVAGDTTTEEGVPLGPTLPVTHSMKEPTNEIVPGYGPGLGADPNSAHLDSPSFPHTSITTPMDQAPPFVGKDGDTVRAHTNQFTEPTTFNHNTAHLLNLTMNRHPTSMMSGEGCLSTTASHLRNASEMASTPSATGDTSELDDLATTTTASSPCEHQRSGQVQPISAEMKPDHAVFQPCITITDPDHIEKSNLNRQFLFHSEHIGRPKAQIAALAARTINSAINIRPMEEKVCSSTEKTLFTDAFLLTATGSSPSTASHRTTGVVLAALDCVASRRYLDTRCVSLHLPLFESGTLGTKGHVQIVLPGLTESYNSQHDDDSGSVTEGPDADGAQSIPYCTLKSFPTLPVHCIEWAREKFTSQFTLKPEKLSQLLSALDRTSPGARLLELASVLLKITSTSKMSEAELKTKATWLCSQLTYSIARFLSSRPVDWVGCVQLARTKFERYFNHKAKQLLHAFPPDTKLADGSPFWQLPKRQPTPLSFRSSDPLHQLFVLSYARLLADQLSISVPQCVIHPETATLETHVDACLIGYTPPSFLPASTRIVTDESESPAQEVMGRSTDTALNSVNTDALDEFTVSALRMSITALQDPTRLKKIYSCRPISFQKDNDQLAHVDFITAASNLRALMYGLPATPRHAVRRIAGRIVPAIATTTATVAGLVCIELVKYVCAARDFRPPSSSRSLCARNAFLNLALPVILLSEPAPCARHRLPNGMTFTLWDRWTLSCPMEVEKFSLSDFLDEIKRRYALEATVITQGNRMVYVNYLPTHRPRLKKPLLTLLATSPEERYVDLTIAYSAGPDAPPDTDYVHGPPVRLFLDALNHRVP